MGGPQAGRYMTALRKYKQAYGPPIRGRGLRMLKKKAQTGQPKIQLILAAPVIINDTCQLPGFVVNLSPIVTMLKHLKNVTMLTNPWAPMSVQLRSKYFFDEALACVRPQTWWVPRFLSVSHTRHYVGILTVHHMKMCYA